MWEKSKGTTKCEKRIVTCDVRTAQCEVGTAKCEKKKVTWYSRLPTSGYRTPIFLSGYRRITQYSYIKIVTLSWSALLHSFSNRSSILISSIKGAARALHVPN